MQILLNHCNHLLFGIILRTFTTIQTQNISPMKNLLYLSIAFALSFCACKKEDTTVSDEFTIAKEGNQTTFFEIASNTFPIQNSFSSNDYDHYFLSVFQNSFSEKEDAYTKSIQGKTTSTPFISQLFVNDYEVPIVDGTDINHYFNSEDNTVITNDPLAILDIKRQGDIPFSFQRGSQTTNGFFPAVVDKINPQLQALEINKNGGTTMTWNADENNSLGVMIVLSAFTTPEKGEVEFINTTDNGSYEFSASDLEKFSPGNQLRIYFIRGNYGINAEKILVGSMQFLHSAEEYTLVE